MKIQDNDTPAIIASKFLGGGLRGVSTVQIMVEIRKRAAAIENRLDDAEAKLASRAGLGEQV